LAFDGLMCDEL